MSIVSHREHAILSVTDECYHSSYILHPFCWISRCGYRGIWGRKSNSKLPLVVPLIDAWSSLYSHFCGKAPSCLNKSKGTTLLRLDHYIFWIPFDRHIFWISQAGEYVLVKIWLQKYSRDDEFVRFHLVPLHSLTHTLSSRLFFKLELQVRMVSCWSRSQRVPSFCFLIPLYPHAAGF